LVNPRNWFAEAVGTYALVFFGPLAIILSVVAFGDGLSIESIIMIALAHGAAVGLMVYAFGHISGAHINPAVTIPMMITKKISVGDGIGYIIFQLIGAVVAAFSLKAILPELGAKVNFGTQGGPSELLNSSIMAGITVEIILTFFLVTVIFLTAVHKKAPAGIHGISIGGMVFFTSHSRCTINRRVYESCKNIWSCSCIRILGTSLALLACTYCRGNNCWCDYELCFRKQS